jgi:hypothetical protein
MNDLHPYDGGTRVFAHADADPSKGLAIVARVLGTPSASLVEPRYQLSFYSGGLGIEDRLAISVTGADALAALGKRLRLCTPEEAAADPNAREDFLWLVEDEDHPLPVAEAAARFLNERRASFQDVCTPTALWFDADSTVNAWTAVWLAEGRLHYLGFDQG